MSFKNIEIVMLEKIEVIKPLKDTQSVHFGAEYPPFEIKPLTNKGGGFRRGAGVIHE